MTTGHRKGDRVLICIKLTSFALCIFVAACGHFPPVHAQSSRKQYEEVPVLSTKDVQQDDHIEEINRHLVATDARVQIMSDVTTKTSLDLSDLQGEARVVGGLLSLLMGTSLILQIRKKTS